ncbi:hypothetical protein [Streptomyces sp. MMBL 11-1]|uniref:hypothetical protein n=1 Tax=Streptomyces sp. MMBL 11-1 TaxID=3026420 RepID=UPI002360A101|nr:hypothetical protein [Streptomyces sp. MMBL 11-1]
MASYTAPAGYTVFSMGAGKVGHAAKGTDTHTPCKRPITKSIKLLHTPFVTCTQCVKALAANKEETNMSVANNVVSVRGGKVHYRAQYLGDHVFPACRTGAMTNSGTKYRTVAAPVDCTTCARYDAAHFAEYRPEVEADPKEDAMPAKPEAEKTTEADTSGEDMSAVANTDVDALISEVHTTIDELKKLDPTSEGAHGKAVELKQEADGKIRKLPAAKRNTLRQDVRAAFKVATTKPEPAPAPEPITPTAVQTRAEADAEAAAEDPRKFEGVDKLIKDGVKAFSEGLDLGLRLTNVGDRLARIINQMRLSIPNPDAGNLPDLMSIRKTTKNGSSAIYNAVRKGIADDDVDRIAAHNSMVRASQNKASDVLVEYLDSFDTMPLEEARATMDARFPGATEKLDENAKLREELDEDDAKRPAELSPSDAIRALYADHGIILPRYGRTELARIDRRVKKLEGFTKELETLSETANAPAEKVEELEGAITELREEIPAQFLEPVKEKTDAEKTADALAAVKAAMERAGKRAKKVKTAKQKQKVKAESYALIRAFVDAMGLDLSALVPADDEDDNK